MKNFDLIKLKEFDKLIEILKSSTYKDKLIIPPKKLQDDRSKWKDKETPLISIIVATYNKKKQLIDDTIPSILKQTYKNIELIVIGDCCTDGTMEAVQTIKDKRLTFVNLPQRTLYPEDAVFRWHVAGGGPFNVGLQLAKGDWIAQINDNDIYVPDAMETLLSVATKNKLELCGGNAMLPDKRINTYITPSYMGAIFRSYLKKYILVDLSSWRWILKPGDKVLIFIMICSNIKYGRIKKVILQKQQNPNGKVSGYGLGLIRKKYQQNSKLYKKIIARENELMEQEMMRAGVIELLQRFKSYDMTIDEFICKYFESSIYDLEQFGFENNE